MAAKLPKVFHEDNKALKLRGCLKPLIVTKDRINAVLTGAGKIDYFKFKR